MRKPIANMPVVSYPKTTRDRPWNDCEISAEAFRLEEDADSQKVCHRLLRQGPHNGGDNSREGNVLLHREHQFARIRLMHPAIAYKELKEKYHCQTNQFAEVFKCELGRCTKTKAKLMLRDNTKPVFKKNPVPYASVPELDEEIDRLEGVISPVDHWPAPIVERKNGRIRLYADFSTGLKDAVQLLVD
ncbi:hypothetical protein OESDEN_00664 [Oesophagostomum dentatum]|uniref:Uncharacterized protein n=1 Tax=Oesophagostomum dentatum TaxID=61180 RepID=A0A0B1TU27_OESDE|nr:hypothetical protein OESDEN_00664 [Oesophagostomum dentatum]